MRRQRGKLHSGDLASPLRTTGRIYGRGFTQSARRVHEQTDVGGRRERDLGKIPSVCRCQSFKTRRCHASWDPMSPSTRPATHPPAHRSYGGLQAGLGGEDEASAHRLTFVSLSKPAQVACHSKQQPAEEKTQGVAGGSVKT